VLDAATSSRVPAEFTGAARVFRTAVQAEDRVVDRALNVIARPLKERLRRHPKLRPEQPMGVLRQWAQSVPTGFLLGHPHVVCLRTEFAITEHRISSSWLYNDEWNNDERERGLSVCRFVFAVRRGKLTLRWTPVACVSLHAMGRWFERSGLREHEALTAALAVLVETDESLERVNTRDGFWLGGVVEAMNDAEHKGVKLRNVRTWLPAWTC
jgi:hypothetical protein